MYASFGQTSTWTRGRFQSRRSRSGFGQIDFEVDTAGMADAAWAAVEPDITAWLEGTAMPKLSASFAEGIESGITQALPTIKKELSAPQTSWAYLAIAGSWAVGLLVGVWLVARNTGHRAADLRGAGFHRLVARNTGRRGG